MVSVLLLEDSDWDAEMETRMLSRNGIPADVERVRTRASFVAALDTPHDVILADYNLPSFDGIQALEIVKERGLDIPFIFVSGSIGEERAVEAFRSGATDYVLKDRLTRLPVAVTRALEEYEQRRKRQRAEDELRVERERLAFALRATNDIIWDWDVRAGRVMMNEAIKSVMGYEDSEVPAQWWEQHVHPDEAGRVISGFYRVVHQSDELTWKDSFRFRRADGEWPCVIFRAAIVREKGEAVRVIGAVLDVTERVLLEQRLEQANRVESLGRLAATMAHEFNNVLMSVMQVSEMIGRLRSDDPRLTRMADQLFNATSRGRRITSEVLRFSHPSEPAIKTFDAAKWLACHVPEMQSLVAQHGVNVHVQVPDTELVVNGDSVQLQQALVNLVTNACDAMPTGGDLTVALSACNHHVELRVSDTGMGMPPKTLAHIFEPLFTTKRHGAGLGLAVVHQAITASGGTIDVESQPGVGTTFTISLPRAPQA